MSVRRILLWSLLWNVLSVAGLCGALVLANFGAPAAVFGLLLVVALTVGLPSTLGFLAVLGLWSGPPLWGFVAVAALAGLALQCGAAALWRAARGRRR